MSKDNENECTKPFSEDASSGAFSSRPSHNLSPLFLHINSQSPYHVIFAVSSA